MRLASATAIPRATPASRASALTASTTARSAASGAMAIGPPPQLRVAEHLEGGAEGGRIDEEDGAHIGIPNIHRKRWSLGVGR